MGEKRGFEVGQTGRVDGNRGLSPVVVFRILSIALFCCVAISFVHAEEKGYGFHNPHFSSDGKLLAFDLCRNDKCDSVIHDIEANTFTKLADRKGRKIVNLSFSPDGDNILFVAATDAFWPWQKASQQLAMGPRTGTKFNLITTTDGLKMYPTFAKVNSVLYWGIYDVPSKQGGGSYKDTQLIELDTKNRQSRQLMPSSFNFYNPSPPYYFDDDHIITSIRGFRQPGTQYEDWLKIRKRDEVFILSKSKDTVNPLNTGIQDSSNPRVIRQTGQIVFIGRLEQDERQRGFLYEAYLYGPEGSIRLTTFSTYMSGIDVTGDGKTLALVIATAGREQLDGRLVIYDVQSKKHREIVPKSIFVISVDIEN